MVRPSPEQHQRHMFEAILVQMINPAHASCRLASEIDAGFFECQFSPFYFGTRSPAPDKQDGGIDAPHAVVEPIGRERGARWVGNPIGTTLHRGGRLPACRAFILAQSSCSSFASCPSQAKQETRLRRWLRQEGAHSIRQTQFTARIPLGGHSSLALVFEGRISRKRTKSNRVTQSGNRPILRF